MNSKEKAKQEAWSGKSPDPRVANIAEAVMVGVEDDESSQSNVDDSGDEQIFRATMAEAPSTKRRAASKARRKRAPSEDSDIEDESSSEESSMRSSGLKSKATKSRATRKRRAPAKAKASAKRPAKKAAKGQGTLDSLLTSSRQRKGAQHEAKGLQKKRRVTR